jgi:hypothetical protein
VSVDSVGCCCLSLRALMCRFLLPLTPVLTASGLSLVQRMCVFVSLAPGSGVNGWTFRPCAQRCMWLHVAHCMHVADARKQTDLRE